MPRRRRLFTSPVFSSATCLKRLSPVDASLNSDRCSRCPPRRLVVGTHYRIACVGGGRLKHIINYIAAFGEVFDVVGLFFVCLVLDVDIVEDMYHMKHS